MTWKRHGIWCGFGPNRHQVELWREMTWNFHERTHVTFFTGPIKSHLNAKYYVFPVKNLTKILMEIPCHFSSQLDLVAVWSKSTPNSMTIPCYLYRCLYRSFPCKTWHGFWTSSRHGISNAFAKKMMGFPVRISYHFRTKPNCRQKDMRKSLSHFWQGVHNI